MSAKVNTKILDLLCILPIVIITVIFYWGGLRNFLFGPDFVVLFPPEGRAADFRVTRYAFLYSLHVLFGLNPLPYHVATLSIHLANSILVFFIVKKLADSRLVGLITALLFSTFWAHPESIGIIATVHEVLLASFILSTLVFFYTYRQNPTKLNYFLVLFFALLAMLSKESAPIILVPLIYLTDRYIALESPEFSRTRLSKAPYIPLLLLSLGLLAYLRFGPVYGSYVHVHYDKAISNFVRWITLTFSFPLLSDAPGWGHVNLLLLALFYFFAPMQIRDRISLLMAAAVLLAIPTAPLKTPGLRYLYLSSFFSMTIFGLMLCYGMARWARTIYIKESFSRALVIALCSVFVYFNYLYVDKLIKYYNRASSISEKVIKMVSSSFPNGTLSAHLIFINFPRNLRYGSYPDNDVEIRLSFLKAYYGQNEVGRISHVSILEVYNGKYILSGRRKNISALEFENLTKEKGNRVYFFNSKDDSIHDVTGKNYTFLKRLVDGN